MTNSDHSTARALNIDYLDKDFVAALEKAWGRETCWPGCIEGYPEDRDDNPSYGNCFVSVLAAWAENDFKDDIIAGKIDETAWHFRLGYVLQRTDLGNGAEQVIFVEVDPTWQQTEENSVFRPLSMKTEEQRAEYQEVITGSIEDSSLLSRLELLLERLETEGGHKIGYCAEEIVSRLKDEFSFVYESDFVEKGIQNENRTPQGPGSANPGPQPGL